MNSICNFIPLKHDGDSLRIIHFVYETELRRLKQPFLHPIYYMYLVTRGTGTFEIAEKEHPLSVGTLFFAFPGIPHRIHDSGNLTYMYISFMGTRGMELMNELGISMQNPVYGGFEDTISFWRRAIQRVHPHNANLLSESVMLYTLSFLADTVNQIPKSDNVLKSIVNYIDSNYTDPDISLKRVADIYSYTDKYLSHLFKSQMNINWSIYVNRLRIQHALEMIGNGVTNLSELSTASGYRDTVYFSKVFKKLMGKTPREYIEMQYTSQQNSTV